MTGRRPPCPPPDARGIVDEPGVSWRLDGPHDPDTIALAAKALDELARHLAHATRDPANVGTAADGYLVVAYLKGVTYRFERTFGQLAVWAEHLADDPSVRDDQSLERRGGRMGAWSAREYLRLAVLQAVELAGSLGRCQIALGHLFHAPDSDDLEGEGGS